MVDDIAVMRRFTRFYTRQVDLLNEGLLHSSFSLAEGRILYELAHRETPTASELVRDLGIDAGYLSRVLKRFEADGLIDRTPLPGDRRQSAVLLTAAGRDAFAPLDAASRRQTRALLEPLPLEARRDLAEAMQRIETLLTPGRDLRGEVTLRPHRIGDLGWIVRRQGLLYAEEYGWDGTYEALVAEILAGFVRGFDPERERAWIAERESGIVGSVFLVRVNDEVAKLRLLYVEPSCRGLGLGSRLVGSCISGARERGYRRLTLWTNGCLVAARAIYLGAGFRLVEEEPHHSFGQDLVGQTWSLDL